MNTGTIKWYSTSKGYGFITPTDGGGDVFLHATSLERAGIQYLSDGQMVSYELATNKGKVSAVNIKLISSTSEA